MDLDCFLIYTLNTREVVYLREFIAGDKFKNEEVLSSLEWYFESKNIHFKQALLVHTPMSTEDRKCLRINYSHYFVSLMSALEMLSDNPKKIS